MKKLEQIRCPRCGLLLMAVRGRAEVKCRKCKSIVLIDTEEQEKVRILA